MSFYYPEYVSASKRRANATREAQALTGKGIQVSPVTVAGREISNTFWGKAWCNNLESYSDFQNRLPRGRSYLRNGSVIHLQIAPGKITSLVSGSHLYRVTIDIHPLQPSRWTQLQTQCGKQIGSVVELLQGRLSTSVMGIVTDHSNGLFPAPEEIKMLCSCPDWAGLCKHAAATLYGVGSRLDGNPELLFKLRQVDHSDLIARAGSPSTNLKSAGRRTIASDALSDVFGIELETGREKADASPAPETRSVRKGKATTAKTTKTTKTKAKVKAKKRAQLRKKEVAGRQASRRGASPAKEHKPTQASDKGKEPLRRKELTGEAKKMPASSKQNAKGQPAKSAKPLERSGKSRLSRGAS